MRIDAAANLAIDCPPLSDDRTRFLDYSAKQVFRSTLLTLTRAGLGSAKELELAAARAHEFVGNTHRFILRDDLRTSDGQKIRPEHFATRLNEVLSSRSPESQWLKNISEVHFDSEELTLKTRFPEPELVSWMSLPALSPVGDGNAGFGLYGVDSICGGEIRLVRNEFAPDAFKWRAPKRLNFFVVKDPEENIGAYCRGEIVRTADTAFPVQEIDRWSNDPDFRLDWKGLFYCLRFEGSLLSGDRASERARILEAIDREELARLLGNLYRPARAFVSSPSGTSRDSWKKPVFHFGRNGVRGGSTSSIRLAYDGYFPNEEVALMIRGQLSLQGIQVECVEDDFAAPSQSCDLRLSILHGLAASDLSIYYSFLHEPKLKESNDYPEYKRTLFETRLGQPACADRVERTSGRLQRILDSLGLATPLLEVPCLFLTRSEFGKGVEL